MQLHSIQDLCASNHGFLALRADGRVVQWGVFSPEQGATEGAKLDRMAFFWEITEMITMALSPHGHTHKEHHDQLDVRVPNFVTVQVTLSKPLDFARTPL